jgi:hypothetical protein
MSTRRRSYRPTGEAPGVSLSAAGLRERHDECERGAGEDGEHEIREQNVNHGFPSLLGERGRGAGGCSGPTAPPRAG